MQHTQARPNTIRGFDKGESMKEEILRCAHCREPLEEGWTECPVCETPIPGGNQCPACGREIKPNWRKCPWCKSALAGGSGVFSGTGSGAQGRPQASVADQAFSPFISSPNAGAVSPGGSPQPDSSSARGPATPFGQPPPTSTIQINPGEELLNGRFCVKKLLGSGGFGSVYLAKDKEMNEDLAFKVVFTQLGQAQTAGDQLKFEFKARKKIRDRTHILEAELPLTDVFKGISLILLPMEYAEGGSLRDWMRANPARHEKDEEISKKRKKQALHYFKQACLGVQAIHEAGLAHLDLKPENLLIRNGVIKVTDFGLSRNILQMSVASPQLLRDGIGTPFYMSPEQIMAARPQDVDHLADIYALGCILFELLDGAPPYMGAPQQILEKHERGVKPKLRGIDESMTGITFKCLSKEPDERYIAISDLLSALDEGFEVSSKELQCEIKGFQWHYLNPKYHSQIAARIIPDTVTIEAKETKEINANTVVERGCAEYFACKNGRLLVGTNTFGLLASGSFDLLAFWLAKNEKIAKENPWHFIKLFCV